MRIFIMLALLLTFSCSYGEPPAMTETIQNVKAKHQERLMALPGVVSVGIGLDADGKPAIVVGLVDPQAQASLELPQTLDGSPVISQVIGPVRAQ